MRDRLAKRMKRKRNCSFPTGNSSVKMANKKPKSIVKAFPGIAFYPQVFSLSSLFKTKTTRSAIRGLLNEQFESKFNSLIIHANRQKLDFVSDALENKTALRKIYTEYGLPMETIEDLKSMLDCLPQYANLPDPERCEQLLDKWEDLIKDEIDCLNRDGFTSDTSSGISDEDDDDDVDSVINDYKKKRNKQKK